MTAIKKEVRNDETNVFSLVNVVHSSPKGVVTEQDIQLWTQAGILPPNTPVEQVLLFSRICAETDLSPSRRQICLIRMFDNYLKTDKYITYVTNDGLRTLLNREGIYYGCEPTYFNVRSCGTFDLMTDAAENLQKGVFPYTCTFTGYGINRNGQKMTYTKTVVFTEFYKSNVFSWQKMPLQMIEKTAKSFVYKEMLGDKLSGVSIEAEIDTAQPILTEGGKTISIVNTDAITLEAEDIAMNAATEKDLIAAVNEFKTKHQIKNLDYCPQVANILRGRVKELRAENTPPETE